MERRDDRRGSVTPLMTVLVLLAALVALGLGRVGGAAAARAQARTAADAAALAGAAEDEAAAQVVAEANGATLMVFERFGDDTRVEVRLGEARATARARLSAAGAVLGGPSGRAPGGSGGLSPALVAALQRAGERLGQVVPITSGYRSPDKQAALWANRATNPFPVAPPGSSKHERGLAVDVPAAFVGRLLSVSAQVGLCHPLPQSDPVHFELC